LEEAAPLFLFQSNTFNISFLNTLLTTIVTSQFLYKQTNSLHMFNCSLRWQTRMLVQWSP